MIEIDQVLAAAQELRPLPASTARLTALLAQRDVDLKEVAEVVSLDMMLTAQILKTANSALYAARSPITVVKDAVTRLGTGIVLSVAMSSTVRREIDRPLPAYDLGEGALWRRSIAAALAAESARLALPLADIPQTAFTAALLHEVGRIVLGRFLTNEVLELLKIARENLGDETQAEAEVLGIHHAEVGALVAQRWKLPDSIIHSIAYYSQPDRGCDRPQGYDPKAIEERTDVICDTVHIADAIAHELTGDTSKPLSRIARGARERLRCDDTALSKMLERSRSCLSDVLDLYGASTLNNPKGRAGTPPATHGAPIASARRP